MIRTPRAKNKIAVTHSSRESSFTQITKITKNGLSPFRPAVAAGKLKTSSQPLRTTHRKNLALRTTKVAPPRKVYLLPATALRVREDNSESWAYKVHDVFTTDELEGRLYAGYRPPFNIVHPPAVKRRGLARMAPQLVAYGRKHKVTTQAALLEASSRPRAGGGLPSGDCLNARVISGRVPPRWLVALRQQSRATVENRLYRHGTFSKARRVRLVRRRNAQVLSFTLRRGISRRANWADSLHRVKAAACSRKYTTRKYRRNSLYRKSSVKRIRRSRVRRLQLQRRSLIRRVERWHARPVMKRLRKRLLLSRRARILGRQAILKRALLKRAHLKRARIKRVRNKRVLAKRAKMAKRDRSIPRYKRWKQLKRLPAVKPLKSLRKTRPATRSTRGGRPHTSTHKRLHSYRRTARLARRQRRSHLARYKESWAPVFLKSYRSLFPARAGFRTKKMLRSHWWRTSRTWFFGVRPYFIRETRRSVRRGRPRYRLRRKIRRSRYRKARRHARTVWGRANFLRYYRKGRYRQYYRRRRLSFTALIKKGLPRDIKTLIRRVSSRYRCGSAEYPRQRNSILLRRRVSRSRRRVTRRTPSRGHVVRKHRNRRFPRIRRAIGKFLLKRAVKPALWLRIAALRSNAPLRTIRTRFAQKSAQSVRLVTGPSEPTKPSPKKVLDLRKTKGGMVYGLRTIFSELAFTRPARRQTSRRLRREHAKSLARLRDIPVEWKLRAQLWTARAGSQVIAGGRASKALVRILSKAKHSAEALDISTVPAKNQPSKYVTRYRPKGQAAALRGTRGRALLSRLTADIRSFERNNRPVVAQHKAKNMGTQSTKMATTSKQQ